MIFADRQIVLNFVFFGDFELTWISFKGGDAFGDGASSSIYQDVVFAARSEPQKPYIPGVKLEQFRDDVHVSVKKVTCVRKSDARTFIQK